MMSWPAEVALNPALYAKMNYDPFRELAPITLAAIYPNVIVVPEPRYSFGKAPAPKDTTAGKSKACPNPHAAATRPAFPRNAWRSDRTCPRNCRAR